MVGEKVGAKIEEVGSKENRNWWKEGEEMQYEEFQKVKKVEEEV